MQSLLNTRNHVSRTAWSFYYYKLCIQEKGFKHTHTRAIPLSVSFCISVPQIWCWKTFTCFFKVVILTFSLLVLWEKDINNNDKAVNLPLWSMCWPQPCQSCHRRGQTSCHCDAGHHAWASSPFCRWIQTWLGSAAWGNLEIDTRRTIHAPSLQQKEEQWAVSQRKLVQHKEVQHWPAVVKEQKLSFKKITWTFP